MPSTSEIQTTNSSVSRSKESSEKQPLTSKSLLSWSLDSVSTISSVKLLKNGNPVINDCISNLDCKIIEKIKKGDHIIFICKVISVQNNDKLKPLIYFNSKYI